MARYAADGSLNITVVDGTSRVGAQASDGSLNVIQVSGSSLVGTQHSSGAFNVVNTDTAGIAGQHPSGALLISDSPYANGTKRVTVVSGSLT